MEADRKSREQERRVADNSRPETMPEYWEQQGNLDARHIPARPGYVQRWVRTHIDGREDPNNVGKRMNQGWRPRMADTVPTNVYVPTLKECQWGNNIIGMYGMILMERPAQLQERQAQAVRENTDNQMRAVEESLFRVHEPGSGLGRPKMESRSRVTRGRTPSVQDD